MQLHNLTPAKGSGNTHKRIGRGQGSGKGGTSTKGHKGAQSRSGYKTRKHLEGGQMPLQRRIPKFGFKNPKRVAYKPLNLDTLQQLVQKADTTTINSAILLAHSLINKRPYKILGKGSSQLRKKLSVSAHACSKSARSAIEKLGGSITILK